jgi:hypothetical protein
MSVASTAYEFPKFQPRREVLTALSWVRREKLPFPISSYGLLGETKVGTDYAWFLIMLILEIIGMWAITRYMPLHIAVGLVALTILLDIAFAVWHHRMNCERHYKVKSYVADVEARVKKLDSTPLSAMYEQKSAKNILIGRIPTAFLIFLTLAKIFFFYRMMRAGISTQVAAVAVGYIIICIIHLRITGFVIQHAIFKGDLLSFLGIRWGFSADVAKYKSNQLDSTFQAQPYTQNIFGSVAFNIAHPTLTSGDQIYKEHRTHKITSNRDNSGLVLQAHGVLYDEDIVGLINLFPQSPEAQTEVAKAALFIQAHLLVPE